MSTILIRLLLLGAVVTNACRAQSLGSGEHSDVILFQNGDRLTGELLSINSRGVVFSNPVVGHLTLPWTSVKQATSSKRYQAVVGSKSANEPEYSKFDSATVEISSTGTLAMKVDRSEEISVAPDQSVLFRDAEPSPASAPAKKSTMSWIAGVNSGQPTSISWGTTSQRTIGGIATLKASENSSDVTDLGFSGSNSRTAKLGVPPIFINIFDGTVQQTHYLSPSLGIYALAEHFFNTSLGMAAQQTYGGGILLDRDCRDANCRLSYGGKLDFRYITERLYSSAPTLDVYGPRIEEHVSYRTQSKKDALKPDNLIISEDVFVNPMINDIDALQWRALFSITKPLSRHVCPGINAENDYIENVPTHHKKNYTVVTIQLTITGGSNPNQRCY
jgi:hypothetical protein